jgi:hypothetical protein
MCDAQTLNDWAKHLIAIAENDDMSDPEAKNTLRESFAAAGLI